jgi:integrase/recombinase XerC/integrase/recombinase XerD
MSTTLPISKLIKNFLSDQDVNSTTKAHQRRVITLFFQWVNANGLDYNYIKRKDIIDYKNHIMKTKSVLTAVTYLAVVRRFFKWAAYSGYFDNVANGIRIKHKYKGFKKEILSKEQVACLLSVADGSSVGSKRDYAILSLLVVRGLRTVELQRANYGDLEVKEGVNILWVQRKARYSKDSFVELPGVLFDILQEYLVLRDDLVDESPLFASLANVNKGQRLTQRTYSGIAKKYLREIGIDNPKITAHSLRHTTAATLIAAGWGIYDVQLYLGHSSPAITEIYTRMAEEQKRLKNSPSYQLVDMFKLK